MNYYNENDPKAAAWLRELIRANLIAPGSVDERSIYDVKPSDLVGFVQCHFFAGIGGWSYALRLAGWPDERPVWTGSCPCQPFSVAGKGLGTADARHLWPQFRRLIRHGRPAVVFGEQVASAAGRLWIDGVCADLEALGYANAAADLCAAGVGAPHIRQRLFWMAHTDLHRGGRNAGGNSGAQSTPAGSRGEDRDEHDVIGEGADGGVAESRPQYAGRGVCGSGKGIEAVGELASDQSGGSGQSGRVAESAGGEWGERVVVVGGDARAQRVDVAGAGESVPGRNAEGDGTADGIGRMDDTTGDGTECGESPIASGDGTDNGLPREAGPSGNGRLAAAECAERKEAPGGDGADCGAGHWARFDLIPCRDGKSRRVESGTFPLAHGVSGRVGLLRGYGNAIVPQVAAAFIQSAVEAMKDQVPWSGQDGGTSNIQH